MYLYGTFVGKSSKLTIDGNSKHEDVESFLKLNPELKNLVTNEDSVKRQYKLMGIEFKKAEAIKPKAKVVTKSKKVGVKKVNKKR